MSYPADTVGDVAGDDQVAVPHRARQALNTPTKGCAGVLDALPHHMGQALDTTIGQALDTPLGDQVSGTEVAKVDLVHGGAEEKSLPVPPPALDKSGVLEQIKQVSVDRDEADPDLSSHSSAIKADGAESSAHHCRQFSMDPHGEFAEQTRLHQAHAHAEAQESHRAEETSENTHVVQQPQSQEEDILHHIRHHLNVGWWYEKLTTMNTDGVEAGAVATTGATSAPAASPEHSLHGRALAQPSATRAQVVDKFFKAALEYQYFDEQVTGFVLDKLFDICKEDDIEVFPFIDRICANEELFDRVYARLEP